MQPSVRGPPVQVVPQAPEVLLARALRQEERAEVLARALQEEQASLEALRFPEALAQQQAAQPPLTR